MPGYFLFAAYLLWGRRRDQLKKNFDGGTALNPAFVGRMFSDRLRDYIAKVDTQLAVALNGAK